MKKFKRENKINFVDDFNAYLGVVIDSNTSFFISSNICLGETPLKSFCMAKYPQVFENNIGDESYFDPKFKIEQSIRDIDKGYSMVIFRVKTPKNINKYIHLYHSGICGGWYEFESLGEKCKG